MKALLHEPLVLFITQAALIIFLSRVVGIGAKKLGQPLVIAEITAGILLGPSLLGWLFPEFTAALFPKSSLPLLGMMSQVGLILFMFLIGLELDPKLLKGKTHTSVAISHSSILLPFLLGAALAYAIHARVSSPDVKFSSFVLFMGAAMSITAFPVLARILVERRLLSSRIGAITIACAAVDDVTAWCILAFVVSIVRSSDIATAIRTSVFALGYIAAMVWLLRPLLRRFAERAQPRPTQNTVAAIIVMLFASSWVTELIGIHALFGAFLFGAILPKQGRFAAALAERLEDVVVVVLLPLFFAYSGLRTQIGLLDSADAWLICAMIIVVACIGKFGGSAVAARLTGLSWRESSAIGILMNTRGLMELIVLNIGLDLGVISPLLFTMMVLMALVTTFMTTPLLELVHPMEQPASAPVTPSVAPPAAEEPYTALICVSAPESGPGLLTLAAAVADGREPRVHALHLETTTDRASFVLAQRSAEAVDRDRVPVLGPLLDHARSLDLAVDPISLVSSDTARDIRAVAAAKRADIVLLGWHKPLLGGTMLSGVVHDVMAGAEWDVGVLVDRGLERVERILVPYLGSEHDRAALALARRIGENVGARITILHVVVPDRVEPLGAQERVQQEFSERGAKAGRYEVVFKVVPHETPSSAVIEESSKGYDLVLIGAGKAWGLEHRSFGLLREAILARARTSVFVLRHGAGTRQAAEHPSVAPAAATSAAS